MKFRWIVQSKTQFYLEADWVMAKQRISDATNFISVAKKHFNRWEQPEEIIQLLFQDPERASQLSSEFPGFYSPSRSSEPSRPLSNGDILPGLMSGKYFWSK